MAIPPVDLFNRGPSPLARVFFYCSLAITCMVVDSHFHGLTLLRNGLALISWPFQEVVQLPRAILTRFDGQWASNQQLKEEEDALRRQVLDLSSRLQIADMARHDLDSLESAIQLRDSTAVPPGSRICEVIGSARNPFIQKVLIGAGEFQGIQDGSPVVTAEGVVGQITAVYPFNSEVTLITNRNLSVPVTVLRTGFRTLAIGQGTRPMISLPYVPVGTDVQPGDVLVTSGIDGLYPRGLVVGVLTAVQRDSVSAFAHVEATPNRGPMERRFVLVLPPRPSGLTPLPPLSDAPLPPLATVHGPTPHHTP